MLALEPVAGNPQPGSLHYQTCHMNWTVWTASTQLSPQPTRRTGPWSGSDHLRSPCVQLEAQPHLQISPRTAHRGTEGNENRAIPQPDWTLSGLFPFGTDHFPRKLLRFLVLIFFFHFHCAIRVKVVAFGSYFPSALLLFLGSRDLFSVRWNAKALSLFGRTQS